MAAKPKADDVVKVFKGLAIAASRARSLVDDFDREKVRGALSRHQQDAVRQSLLDIEKDVNRVLNVMTQKGK